MDSEAVWDALDGLDGARRSPLHHGATPAPPMRTLVAMPARSRTAHLLITWGVEMAIKLRVGAGRVLVEEVGLHEAKTSARR